MRKKIRQQDNPIKYAGDVSSMNDLNARLPQLTLNEKKKIVAAKWQLVRYKDHGSN